VERPKVFLKTLSTNSTDYQDLVVVQISTDAQGVSFFVLSIDPDPDALYQILVANLLKEVDLEITAVWTLELAHLTCGVYKGFKAGDSIVVRHKSKSAAVTVKSGVSLAFNEVVQ